jgi:hypothetical protein
MHEVPLVRAMVGAAEKQAGMVPEGFEMEK